jgi:hypothetical protein
MTSSALAAPEKCPYCKRPRAVTVTSTRDVALCWAYMAFGGSGAVVECLRFAIDGERARVASLEDAIGVMVGLCLRGYLTRCDEADRQGVRDTILRLEKVMHPNAEPETCEACAKMFRHAGEGYECMTHTSPMFNRHLEEARRERKDDHGPR